VADALEPKTPPKKAPRAEAPGEGQLVPLAAFSAPLRRLLEETPRKEWYRIKAVRAGYQETFDLVLIVNALEYLLKVSPDKALRRVMEGQVEEGAFYAVYRGIRDEIRTLREKCQALAEVAGVEVKAWSDGRGRAHRALRPGPSGIGSGGVRPPGVPRETLPVLDKKVS
jgi:hypothetical protein